jgi:hypothetical protein
LFCKLLALAKFGKSQYGIVNKTKYEKMNIEFLEEYVEELNFEYFRPKTKFNKKLKNKRNWRLFDSTNCYDKLDIKNTKASEVKFLFGVSSSKSSFKEDYYLKSGSGSLNGASVIVNARGEPKLYCLSYEPLEESDEFFVTLRGFSFNLFSAYRFWSETYKLSEGGQKSFKAFLNSSDKLFVISEIDMYKKVLRY